MKSICNVWLFNISVEDCSDRLLYTLVTRNGKMKLQFFIVAGNTTFLMVICEEPWFFCVACMVRYILVNWRRVIYCQRRTFVATIADYTVPVACIMFDWKCQKRLTLLRTSLKKKRIKIEFLSKIKFIWCFYHIHRRK